MPLILKNKALNYFEGKLKCVWGEGGWLQFWLRVLWPRQCDGPVTVESKNWDVTPVWLTMPVCWGVALCHGVCRSGRSEGYMCLHLQSQAMQQNFRYFFKYNQQDATSYNILYYCQCQACLLLPLAVAPSKLGIYPMLCVQFLSSWWCAEKPPETCRALKAIKNIV